MRISCIFKNNPLALKPYSKDEILDFLNRAEFGYRASQKKLCLPLINRLAHKMCVGLTFPDIKVCEGMIIDGHHRYVAARLTGFELAIVPHRKCASASAVFWGSMDIVEQDYDTSEAIENFLAEDAKFNGKSLEDIVELLGKR